MSLTTRRHIGFCTAPFVLSLLLFPATVQAGGLYLNEFGTATMGVANTGTQAVARDANTALHNPAGMTALDGKALSLGAGLLYADIQFDPSSSTPVPGNDGGQAGAPGPILNASYVHPLGDPLPFVERLRFGFNLNSISAAALDYRIDWTGRYLVDDVFILTLQFFPSLAFQVTDWLSIGGGPRVLYGYIDEHISLQPLLPKQPDGTIHLNGLDDWAVGGSVGAFFDIGERAKAGIVYNSEIGFELTGDVDISAGPLDPSLTIDTDLPLVQNVRLSWAQDVTDELKLLFSVGWEDWSALENQFISIGSATGSIPRGWGDTWYIGLGAEYQLTERWKLQTGFKYDSSPVEPSKLIRGSVRSFE